MVKDTKNKLEKSDKNTEVGAAIDMEAEAGNNFDKDDLVIPRINLLQSLSPQRQKAKDEFIKEAEDGDIFNTATLELISGETGITVIPVAYRRALIEWKLRADGGGFVADHGTNSSVLNGTKKDEQGRDITSDGTQIVTTGEYYVAIVNPKTGGFSFAVLSMSSTQYKKAKRWNTMINNYQLPKKDGSGTYNPPMYARSYDLTSVPESNDKGAWFGWDIAAGKPISDIPDGDKLYAAIREFRKQVDSGAVKATPEGEGSGAGEDDAAPF